MAMQSIDGHDMHAGPPQSSVSPFYTPKATAAAAAAVGNGRTIYTWLSYNSGH